jgi:short-subunit dehydrogenase
VPAYARCVGDSDDRGVRMQLAGAVALVTGASDGIGRAVALLLAQRGAKVLVHGRSADRTAAVAAAVGGQPLLADLDTTSERDRLAREALAVHGRVDILVSNAGAGWSGPLTSMGGEEARRLIDVDLVAPVQLTRLLLPGMLERSTGHLAFVSSVAGRLPVAGEAVYSAAKAGLDAFAESLRLEAAHTGIGVSVCVPAVVRTGFFATRGRPYDRRFPRPVAPERVAAAVVEAIAEGRADSWVPRWPRYAAVARAVAPSTYRRLNARFGERVRLPTMR